MIAQGWSLATVFSLLAWYEFAPRCISTLSIVKRETNSIRDPLLMAGHLFALAYLAAFVQGRIARIVDEPQDALGFDRRFGHCVHFKKWPYFSPSARWLRRALGIGALLGVVCVASSLQAQDGNAGVPELRLSTALAPSFPLGRAGERWAQLVNEKAGGAFEVRQYPGATLASRDPGREFGALKSGLAELAVGSALAWSAQFAPLGVYAIPWLTGSAREQEALAADAPLRESVFAQMATAGVIGLAVAPLGEHVLATTRAPVETPADLHGLRVRVLPLRSLIDVYLALGALPQSMNFAQAQAALAAGTLDGQDAMPTTLVADARVRFRAEVRHALGCVHGCHGVRGAQGFLGCLARRAPRAGARCGGTGGARGECAGAGGSRARPVDQGRRDHSSAVARATHCIARRRATCDRCVDQFGWRGTRRRCARRRWRRRGSSALFGGFRPASRAESPATRAMDSWAECNRERGS